MTKHTYIDLPNLTKLSDENAYNEYLKQRTFTKNKKGNGVSNEMKDLIRNMVNKLNNENKAIVHLKFWEDLSNEEIAERTGKHLSTVEKRINESLRILKDLFLIEMNSKENIKA
jgi:RNA polymerase sigma factor (sigma-70 family)